MNNIYKYGNIDQLVHMKSMGYSYKMLVDYNSI